MKLFKLFALSLVALPSVALGMELSVVVCGSESYDLSSISTALRQSISEAVDKKILNRNNLEFLLGYNKKNVLTGFFSKKNSAGDIEYCAIFGALNTAEIFVFATEYNGAVVPSSTQVLSPLSPTPWYRRRTVWCAAAAAVGLGYYYRDTLAELIRNASPAIEKAQSFWAQTAAPRAMSLWTGIKSVFSR